jgi:hypothetical protein
LLSALDALLDEVAGGDSEAMPNVVLNVCEERAGRLRALAALCRSGEIVLEKL